MNRRQLKRIRFEYRTVPFSKLELVPILNLESWRYAYRDTNLGGIVINYYIVLLRLICFVLRNFGWSDF